MPVGSSEQGVEPARRIAALAAGDSCARHPLIHRLAKPGAAGRDLADAVHALCAVHGRMSTLFEEAMRRAAPSDAAWLSEAATAFAAERSYLARLTAAVGPLPSTPGQSESDAAFASQRHAFDMLARSDRAGCATGAALALAIDWQAFRGMLDAAAHRTGIAVPRCNMPSSDMLLLDETPAIHRAMAFGAQQAFAQHRGLCDLVEARATARDLL